MSNSVVDQLAQALGGGEAAIPTEKDKQTFYKKAAKGKAEGDKAEAEVELEAVTSELELLSNKSNDLHSSCDFMMKNFDIRQSRRDDEMEALKSAVGILSGAR